MLLYSIALFFLLLMTASSRRFVFSHSNIYEGSSNIERELFITQHTKESRHNWDLLLGIDSYFSRHFFVLNLPNILSCIYHQI